MQWLDNHASNAIFENRDMEVQDESELRFPHSHVGQQLRLVQGKNFFDCLELDYDALGNEYIYAKS